MDKKNIPDISAGKLKNLCRRVEETYGKPVLTPLQFEALADDIFRRTGKLLRPTTLKRLWDYLKECHIILTSALMSVTEHRRIR